MTPEQLVDMMVRLNEENLDLQMHIVGDGGFRVICDAAEEAMKQCGDDWKIQLELCHCESIHEDDETRPAELGLIINWTPHWTGGYFGEAAIDWLGEERFNDMYDFQPMIEAGAIVDFGSDTVSKYEFHRSSPFFGMETAITRVESRISNGFGEVSRKYATGRRSKIHHGTDAERLYDQWCDSVPYR